MINLREALERNPTNLEARVYLAATMESSGAQTDAAWEVEEIRALQPGFDIDTWLDSYPMTNPGQQQTLRSILTPLGL